MATITPTSASSNASITPAAASGGGDTLALGSSQRGVLNIVNASGSSINVTLTAVKTCNVGAGFLHNVVIACAAGKTTPIGLSINDPNTSQCIDSSGNVAITYSAVTSVTVYANTN
jgi:hypothetical protein